MSTLEDQKSPNVDGSSQEEIQKMQSTNRGDVSDIQLDPELEKQTLRRFDLFLLPQIAILIVIGYLDRTNVGRFPDDRVEHSPRAKLIVYPAYR